MMIFESNHGASTSSNTLDDPLDFEGAARLANQALHQAHHQHQAHPHDQQQQQRHHPLYHYYQQQQRRPQHQQQQQQHHHHHFHPQQHPYQPQPQQQQQQQQQQQHPPQAHLHHFASHAHPSASSATTSPFGLTYDREGHGEHGDGSLAGAGAGPGTALEPDSVEARRLKRKEQNRLAQRRHREKQRNELKKRRLQGSGSSAASAAGRGPAGSSSPPSPFTNRAHDANSGVGRLVKREGSSGTTDGEGDGEGVPDDDHDHDHDHDSSSPSSSSATRRHRIDSSQSGRSLSPPPPPVPAFDDAAAMSMYADVPRSAPMSAPMPMPAHMPLPAGLNAGQHMPMPVPVPMPMPTPTRAAPPPRPPEAQQIKVEGEQTFDDFDRGQGSQDIDEFGRPKSSGNQNFDDLAHLLLNSSPSTDASSGLNVRSGSGSGSGGDDDGISTTSTSIESGSDLGGLHGQVDGFISSHSSHSQPQVSTQQQAVHPFNQLAAASTGSTGGMDQEHMRQLVSLVSLQIPWANRLLAPRWDLVHVLGLASKRLGLMMEYIEEDTSVSFLAVDYQCAATGRSGSAALIEGREQHPQQQPQPPQQQQWAGDLGPVLKWNHVPDNMKPSPLAGVVAHHPYIDLSFPWPAFRDRILAAMSCGLLHELQLCYDVWPGESHDPTSADPPYWIHGDDPFDPEAYEVSDRIALRYPWLLDEGIIRRTNWWRRQQSKKELPQHVRAMCRAFHEFFERQKGHLLRPKVVPRPRLSPAVQHAFEEVRSAPGSAATQHQSQQQHPQPPGLNPEFGSSGGNTHVNQQVLLAGMGGGGGGPMHPGAQAQAQHQHQHQHQQ